MLSTMNFTWKQVWTKNGLPNLHVLENDGKEVGFIFKPKDTKTDKNMWRVYIGIGDAARFVGHSSDKIEAKSILALTFCFGNASVVEV